jgi:AraC-like DNA-binding protein
LYTKYGSITAFTVIINEEVQDMLLKFFIPCELLQPYIGRIWVFESTSGIPDGDMKTIAPNGKIKLIIQYKKNLKSTMGNIIKDSSENSVIIIGQSTIPAIIESETEVGTIGIEFKPFAVYKFLNFPLNEITNQVNNLQDVMGNAGYNLQQRLMEVATIEAKVRLVEDFLIHQFYSLRKHNPIAEYAVKRIILSNGLIRIDELSDKLGYTKRHVDRIFSEYIGIGPKEFSSIIRFQTFYKKFHSSADFKAADFYDSYYDQSHFIKEFRKFTGYSPGGYLKKSNNFGKIFLNS